MSGTRQPTRFFTKQEAVPALVVCMLGVVRLYRWVAEQNNHRQNDHKRFQLKLNHSKKDEPGGKGVPFKGETSHKPREVLSKALRA